MRAGARTDVRATILKGRKLPCICPQQFAKGATNTAKATGYSTSRGILVERVECQKTGCNESWRRIHCKD